MGLNQLLAERDIYCALVAIARAMDQRDWPALAALTTQTMTADLGLGPLVGREAFIHTMRSFLDDCGPTQHLLGNILIKVSGDTASSKAYVSDMHVGAGEKSAMTFRTLGDYHDSWQKIGGHWRMTHRRKLHAAHLGSFEVLGPGPS